MLPFFQVEISLHVPGPLTQANNQSKVACWIVVSVDKVFPGVLWQVWTSVPWWVVTSVDMCSLINYDSMNKCSLMNYDPVDMCSLMNYNKCGQVFLDDLQQVWMSVPWWIATSADKCSLIIMTSVDKCSLMNCMSSFPWRVPTLCLDSTVSPHWAWTAQSAHTEPGQYSQSTLSLDSTVSPHWAWTVQSAHTEPGQYS